MEKTPDWDKTALLIGQYYGNNVGASLTVWALNELLKSANIKVKVARILPDKEMTPPRQRMLDVVSEYYDFTEPRTEATLHAERANCRFFVVASDQLWSPLPDGNDLGFKPKLWYLACADRNVRKISVATSFGTSRHAYSETRLPIVTHLLKRFNFLSVRERSGVDILNGIGVGNGRHILDPVFLLPLKRYDELAEKAKYRMEGNFVFAYSTTYSKEFLDYCVRVKEMIGADKVFVMSVMSWVERAADERAKAFEADPRILFYRDATSADFLYNIKRCAYAVVRSFHGTCFAVMYKRPFTSVIPPEKIKQARFEIFRDMGYDARLVTEKNLAEHQPNPRLGVKLRTDYLNRMKFRSFLFLRRAFERLFPTNYENLTNIRVVPPTHCAGCGACVAVCPTGAIRLQEDENGFRQTAVDETKCVKCKKCLGVCPLAVIVRPPQIPVDDGGRLFLAVRAEDAERRLASSGGAFGVMANYILSKGGVVCGAAWDEGFRSVSHIMAETETELEKLRQSKYIQSDATKIYPQVIAALKSGRDALFTGTPCQCAAMRRYAAKELPVPPEGEADNRGELFLVDIICHGVNTSLLWEKYLEETTNGQRVVSAQMRGKGYGWKTYEMRLELADGTVISEPSNLCNFSKLFIGSCPLRESCYDCLYASRRRVGDITIGDLWSATRVRRDLYDPLGVSAVSVNTSKGKELWEAVRDAFPFVEALPYAEFKAQNPQYEAPAKTPAKRDLFFQLLKEGKSLEDIITELQ